MGFKNGRTTRAHRAEPKVVETGMTGMLQNTRMIPSKISEKNKAFHSLVSKAKGPMRRGDVGCAFLPRVLIRLPLMTIGFGNFFVVRIDSLTNLCLNGQPSKHLLKT